MQATSFYHKIAGAEANLLITGTFPANFADVDFDPAPVGVEPQRFLVMLQMDAMLSQYLNILGVRQHPTGLYSFQSPTGLSLADLGAQL